MVRGGAWGRGLAVWSQSPCLIGFGGGTPVENSQSKFLGSQRAGPAGGTSNYLSLRFERAGTRRATRLAGATPYHNSPPRRAASEELLDGHALRSIRARGLRRRVLLLLWGPGPAHPEPKCPALRRIVGPALGRVPLEPGAGAVYPASPGRGGPEAQAGLCPKRGLPLTPYPAAPPLPVPQFPR